MYDFPSSPVENQEYTPAGGKTYVWKAPKWVVKETPDPETQYVNVAGDTMTGGLIIRAGLSVDNEVEVSGDTFINGPMYVDGNAEFNGDAQFWGTSTQFGSTVTIPTPTAAMHAATKQYADLKVAKTGDTMTGTLATTTVTGPLIMGGSDAGTLSLSGGLNAVQHARIHLGGQSSGYPKMAYYDADTHTFRKADSGTANAIIVAGVQFPATQVASADANTLDDYEVGTYTPTWSFAGAAVGMTYSATRFGNYVKVGDLCWAQEYVTLTAKGTSVGQIRYSLPFTVNAATYSPAVCTYYTAHAMAVAGAFPGGYGQASAAYVLGTQNSAVGGHANVVDTNLGATASRIASITFRVA